MLKIHSFLQRVKTPISKMLPNNIGKYKIRMVVIAYTMATVLFILSPDYIYGASNNGVEVYAKAEMEYLVDAEIEETANEAIVRTKENNEERKFLLCNLTTDGNPIGYEEQLALTLTAVGKDINGTVLSLNMNDSKEMKVEEESRTNSQQVGADVDNKVDSSSTDEKKPQDAETVVKETVTTETQKTTDTEQEAEKTDTQNTEQKVIDLSSEDIEILQRIVEAEATGEDIKGKILVANVILNRVKDENFPNTIEGVVFQKDGNTYQFSPIKDDRYWSVEVTKDTITAVKRVVQGEDYSQGALYFSARSRADEKNMQWFDTNLEYLFKYGGHEFFKD